MQNGLSSRAIFFTEVLVINKSNFSSNYSEFDSKQEMKFTLLVSGPLSSQGVEILSSHGIKSKETNHDYDYNPEKLKR